MSSLHELIPVHTPRGDTFEEAAANVAETVFGAGSASQARRREVSKPFRGESEFNYVPRPDITARLQWQTEESLGEGAENSDGGTPIVVAQGPFGVGKTSALIELFVACTKEEGTMPVWIDQASIVDPKNYRLVDEGKLRAALGIQLEWQLPEMRAWLVEQRVAVGSDLLIASELYRIAQDRDLLRLQILAESMIGAWSRYGLMDLVPAEGEANEEFWKQTAARAGELAGVADFAELRRSRPVLFAGSGDYAKAMHTALQESRKAVKAIMTGNFSDYQARDVMNILDRYVLREVPSVIVVEQRDGNRRPDWLETSDDFRRQEIRDLTPAEETAIFGPDLAPLRAARGNPRLLGFEARESSVTEIAIDLFGLLKAAELLQEGWLLQALERFKIAGILGELTEYTLAPFLEEEGAQLRQESVIGRPLSPTGEKMMIEAFRHLTYFDRMVNSRRLPVELTNYLRAKLVSEEPELVAAVLGKVTAYFQECVGTEQRGSYQKYFAAQLQKYQNLADELGVET